MSSPSAASSLASRVIPPPKPKLSKAERRAMQEAQRAAKGAAADGSKPVQQKKKPEQAKDAEKSAPSSKSAPSASKNGAPAAKSSGAATKQTVERASQRGSVGGANPPPLPLTSAVAAHIPDYIPPAPPGLNAVSFPAPIVRLGDLYASNTITGSNARATALLNVYSTFISTYTPPPNKLYSADLVGHLNNFFQYLTMQRPHSLSMGSAQSFLKSAVQALDSTIKTEVARAALVESISRYILEKITCSQQVIADLCLTKINNDDTILTFGSSVLLTAVFSAAAAAGKKFKVVVLDSRVNPTGLALAEHLAELNVPVTYTLFQSLSYVLPTCTKVLLSCCGITSNGSVYASAGTSGIAVSASRLNIPVLVCCETYKFSSKVIRDSLSVNEKGDPRAVALGVTDGDCNGLLSVVNLKFDITKSEFISGVVTETGIVPPSSVAVVLREIEQ